MKTIIDKSNAVTVSKYSKLFDMANKALEGHAVNMPKDAEGNQLMIETLEQYFSVIGTLMSIDKKFVYLLPLDEEFFEINANTRAITVPRSFSTGAGVQTDVISETLLFKVNRFVDAKNLADVQNIWIQWQFGPNNAPTSTGVFKVDFRYIDYDADYLIFAWPLMGAATQGSGSLKFSVCFEDKDGDGNVIYSLNTLSATITIHPALKVDADYEAEHEDASDLFEAAIQNAKNTSSVDSDAIKAEMPVFYGDGLPEKYYLTESKKPFKVFATAADTGTLTYKWVIPTGNSGVTSGQDFALTNDATAIPYKRYYEKVTKASGEVAYNLITLADHAAVPEDTYEYVAYLTLNEEGPITGKYTLNAENRYGWSITSTTSDADKGEAMIIPGPEDLDFIENVHGLPESGVNHIVDGKVVLATKTLADDLVDLNDAEETIVRPKITYTWEKTVDSDANSDQSRQWYVIKTETLDAPTGGQTVSTIEMDAVALGEALVEDGIPEAVKNLPGWYRVHVSSTVNRETTVPYDSEDESKCKSLLSNECKVTNRPVAPLLSRTSEDHMMSYEVSEGDNVDLEVDILNPYANDLECEQLCYQWFDSDGDAIDASPVVMDIFTLGQLNESKLVEDAAHRKVLRITKTIKAGNSVASYYCKVWNNLNGDKAESKSCYFALV